MKHFKRTKVIATVGPALTQKLFTWEAFNDPVNQHKVKLAYDNIAHAIHNGVNTFRLNFSHGSHDEQLIRIKIIREVAKKVNRNVSILLDTKGPEIRVREMSNDDGVLIESGKKVIVQSLKFVKGTANEFSVTDSTGKYNMAKDVKVGRYVLVDDGKLRLLVNAVDIKSGMITTTSENSHLLKTNKRINLPGTEYSMPFLSEKDIIDIKLAADQNLDYIAASFVNTPDCVKQIKKLLKEHKKPHIKIISKIESTQAISHIDAIIKESDGIMIARGDFGLEIPYYEVPHWEKYIIKACRLQNKPVIVATQMLDSLERTPQPTRAEVTDVFFAVERGADATMLSGETAQGLYPLESIIVMSTIDKKSEELFDYERALEVYFPKTPIYKTPAGKIAAKVAKEIAPEREMVDALFKLDYLVVFTNDGSLVEALSTVRLPATIVVITDNEIFSTAFGITYAIETHLVKDLKETCKNKKAAAKTALSHFPKGTAKILENDKLIDIK